MSLKIHLQPLGVSIEVEHGASLHDVLFPFGVEFPCGGRAHCQGCKIKVVEGELATSEEQERILTKEQTENGWRLACCCRVEGDIMLDVQQFDSPVLVDDATLKFTPRAGYGIAIDLGTTTIAAQVVNLETGNVLVVETALNKQARFGADIMSRLAHAREEGGRNELERTIRLQIQSITEQLLHSIEFPEDRLNEIFLCGNTAMHHLFSCIDVASISAAPFDFVRGEEIAHKTQVRLQEKFIEQEFTFLPCIGGFVGSDILAGIIATDMQHSSDIIALIDLGTNGEIVIGNREKILCASTAAGPAFEGGRISMGMRAAKGAISKVTHENGAFVCDVIGGGDARGICGSGLIDAVGESLKAGLIHSNGRIADGCASISLTNSVGLTQKDVREVQLAKGAVAAGFHMLTQRFGCNSEDVARVYLAGAFGNYIDAGNAIRIGLLPVAAEKIIPAGNTALRGTKMILLNDPDLRETNRLRKSIQHIPLHADQRFQQVFIEEMNFPLNK